MPQFLAFRIEFVFRNNHMSSLGFARCPRDAPDSASSSVGMALVGQYGGPGHGEDQGGIGLAFQCLGFPQTACDNQVTVAT